MSRREQYPKCRCGRPLRSSKSLRTGVCGICDREQKKEIKSEKMKKAKMVYLPFNTWSVEKIKKGIKTATTRTRPFGETGDYFKVGKKTFVITNVSKLPLSTIAEQHFREEGAESPSEFIQVWCKIHPRRGFVPRQPAYCHQFREAKL